MELSIDNENNVCFDGQKVHIETLIDAYKYRKDEKNRLREYIAGITMAQLAPGNPPVDAVKKAITCTDTLLRELGA